QMPGANHRRRRAIMRRLSGGIYGVRSLEEWERRAKEGPRGTIHDLSDTKEPSGDIPLKALMMVSSFIRLVDVNAFLTVMNKSWTLLHRGQSQVSVSATSCMPVCT